ncbi:MAG: TnpV protein, partial [Oscillospiraceae bacterium]|nr:TnpV protein [Oscillospiraceae bacterium]
MEKSIFEQMGGTYTKVGDYYLPDLALPAEEQQPIGIWGQRHLRHIKQNRRALYTNLLTSGKLNSYLADINR